VAAKEIFELTPLFEEVQLSCVFDDGKTFVDCIPKESTEFILQKYLQQKNDTDFDLKKFVLAHFDLPLIVAEEFHSDSQQNIKEHIDHLWKVLTRNPDEKKGSLIPLPNSYIVPGGRFGEVYYWDSYFTMLGLQVSGMNEMIENMVNNFSHLIQTIGFIPNGNRTYYLGRSQPPFFSVMVKLLASVNGKQVLPSYLQSLEKEYLFWMKGVDGLSKTVNASLHIVRMKDGELLNRYWDENNTARPESYLEDVELSHSTKQAPEILFRHLRAGAESGWDYSCRWFKDGQSFATIHTTEIIPVDLNCLLFHLEQTIAEAYKINGSENKAEEYSLLAEKRKQAIHKYCWSDEIGFYVDYDFISGEFKQIKTLAAVASMFFNIATNDQANTMAAEIEKEFLKPGGLVTTLQQTGQQWDSPNGWAPLQWMAIIGMENYGHDSLAETIAERWIQLNTDVFKRTGKLMEKYNVVDTHLDAGGGEYPGQDGFGWTNGVLLALMKKYEKL
jgi:alpha,alpha-trehalase